MLKVLILGALLVVGVAYLFAWGAQLASVEKKVDKIDTTVQAIASVLETLIVVQPINRIESDNSILLDFDPVPRSVKIVSGPLVDYPNPSYGYRLEGRQIYILAPVRLKELKERAGTGGLTVEYIRKIDFKK